jgi:hypothetical protein
MNIINRVLLSGMVMAAMIFTGCKKETTKNVSKTFKVPVITIKGSALVTLAVGTVYTDAGADYLGENGQVTALQSSSSNVNTAVPGLYFVTYTKESESGAFESEEVRLVAVTSVNDPVDYSGTYFRSAGPANAIVTKVANGVYKVNNPGGSPTGTGVDVYFVETAPGTFVAPSQPTAVGPFAVNTITFTATGSSWKVVNSGYGTQLRTFVKQ